jgi:hypothetical protein
MASFQHQQMEVKTQRSPMLRTTLIQGINRRLLHLFEILQPLQIPKQNVILVHTVSNIFKKLRIFGPQHIDLLTITTTTIIVVCHFFEKI